MSFNVIPTHTFKREAKRLLKKYPSLKQELAVLNDTLIKNPEIVTFSPNSSNLVARVFFFLLTLVWLYLLANLGLKDPSMKHIIFRVTQFHFIFKVIYLMYFLIIAIIFLAVTIVLSLLGIYRIEVNDLTRTMTFDGLLRSRTIQADQIVNYFDTIHRNGYKEWPGLILNLKDQSTINIVGQNVEDIPSFKEYLDEIGINRAGTKNMKFPFN